MTVDPQQLNQGCPEAICNHDPDMEGIQRVALIHKGDLLITIACDQGHVEIVGMLINTGADMDKRNASGGTAYMLACTKGYAAIVNLLLNRGVNYFLTTVNGSTGMLIACAKGHVDVVRCILRFPGYRMFWGKARSGTLIGETNNFSETPLIVACMHGHRRVVDELVKDTQGRGTVNMKDEKGNTPLIYACKFCYTEIVNILLLFTDAEPNVRNMFGNTGMS